MRRLHLLPLFALALLAAPVSAQTTWFVDASATPPGNGTPGSPYSSIQYAHDQASTLSGDTLSIAPGDYTEFLYFAQGKALTLDGAGALQTRLRGGALVENVAGQTLVQNLGFYDEPVEFVGSYAALSNVRVLDVQAGSGGVAIRVANADSNWDDVIVAGASGGGVRIANGTAVIDGLNVVDCAGSWGGLSAFGATLTISDSYFGNNHIFDGNGGALYLDNCQTTLVNCGFEDNTASLDGRLGGAIYQSGGQLSILGALFEGNRADRGGALAIAGTASLYGVTFQANVAQRDGTNQFMPGQGGAILVTASGILDADDCDFLVNSAPVGLPAVPEDQRGGAIFVESPGSRVTASLFADNVAGREGSAVWGPLVLERCIVRLGINSTTGGAIHGATLDRCTVFFNSPAGGSAAVVDATVASSILWANSNGQLGGSSSATYSCIEGGAAGVGNIASDPKFVDLGNDIVSLQKGSPCIDAGDPSLPPDSGLTPADMGALPYQWQPIGTNYCSSNPNSSGQTAVIAALGSTTVADDFVRLRALQTAKNQIGLFLMSQNQGFVPLFGGSQGNLCLGSPIFRIVGLPDAVGSSGDLGLLGVRLDLLSPPYGPAVQPGQTWHFQAWFRDKVAGQNTSNTSNAVSVTFQ